MNLGTTTPAAPHTPPASAHEHLHLRDGRCVTLRPVQPSDAEAEQRFVSALSPRARLLRFHGAVNLLPAAVLQQMTALDTRTHVALVAQACSDDGLPGLVADARFVINAQAPWRAEFAVAVADPWQRQGLARTLLQRLADAAQQRGVLQLEGDVMQGNEAMLALVRSLGGQAGAGHGAWGAWGVQQVRFML